MNNLLAEMSRYGIRKEDIQKQLKCSENTVNNKLSGKTEFTFSECITIRDTFFKGHRLEYLFATSNKIA